MRIGLLKKKLLKNLSEVRKMNELIVDGVSYTEESIRELLSALEYNRETLKLYKKGFNEIKEDINLLMGKTTDPRTIFEGSAEGVEAHADS